MLLPESFQGSVAPEAFVAWDEDRRTIAAAAAFHRLPRETANVQVATVKPFRRQGIGSRLLARIVDVARERGDEHLTAWTDALAKPGSDAFLEANGFVAGKWMLRLEGELEPIRQTLLLWRERLIAAGKAPATSRVVEHHELPAGLLRSWYEQAVAPALEGRPEFGGYLLNSPEFDSTILLVDERPAGMLAGVRNHGDGAATLRAVFVAPEFQGGWGWANVLLLASGFERAWSAGARRVRFETTERNWKVLESAGRVGAKVVGRSARFVLPL